MTRLPWISGAVALVVAGLFAAWPLGGDSETAPLPRVGGNDSWRTDPVWDDGNAEYAAYRIKWRRYGRLNPGKALMVLVKEPWDAKEQVKSEGAGDFDVMKLNHLRDVPTGIYTYHQMGSVFVGRDDGVLHKVSTTSAEACGHSSAIMTNGRLRAFTYWDDDAEETVAWPKDAIPEDGLPAILRGFVEGDLPASLSVFPSLMASRHMLLEPSDFSLERERLETVTVPAGRFAGVRLELKSGSRWMRYTFDAAMPHSLLRLERHDGTSYELMKVDRIPYWNMSGPGGEKWWPEELR